MSDKKSFFTRISELFKSIKEFFKKTFALKDQDGVDVNAMEAAKLNTGYNNEKQNTIEVQQEDLKNKEQPKKAHLSKRFRNMNQKKLKV